MNLSARGDEVLRYQGRLCVLDVNDLRREILKEANGSVIPFIRVPPKCIVISKNVSAEWFEEGYRGIFGQMS